MVLLLTCSAASARADEGQAGRTRVLHEPPPSRGQRGRNDILIPGNHGDAGMAAAIETAAGTVKRPATDATGPQPPRYDAPAHAGDPADVVRPDRRSRQVKRT